MSTYNEILIVIQALAVAAFIGFGLWAVRLAAGFLRRSRERDSQIAGPVEDAIVSRATDIERRLRNTLGVQGDKLDKVSKEIAELKQSLTDVSGDSAAVRNFVEGLDTFRAIQEQYPELYSTFRELEKTTADGEPNIQQFYQRVRNYCEDTAYSVRPLERS